MTSYGYSESRIASIICAMKRRRLGSCAVATGILAGALLVAAIRPEWIFGPHQQARMWVVLALVLFVAGPLADTLWCWKSRPGELARSLRATRVAVGEEQVWVTTVDSGRHLHRSEIVGAQETCWGVYLRSENRYRWILVSSQTDRFAEFKNELKRMHVPIMAAAVPPNWEELVGAAAFIATMLCAVFARNADVLTADLVISVIVAVVGFAVVSANPENSAKMRLARFGIFLPVAMTGSMLWTALR